MAHIALTNERAHPPVVTERDVAVQPGSIALDDRDYGWVGVAWFDLLYRTLNVQPSRFYAVPVLYPNAFVTSTIDIAVASEPVEIEVGSAPYTVLRCVVTSETGLDEVHYVTLDGELVRAERARHDVVLELESGG